MSRRSPTTRIATFEVPVIELITLNHNEMSKAIVTMKDATNTTDNGKEKHSFATMSRTHRPRSNGCKNLDIFRTVLVRLHLVYLLVLSNRNKSVQTTGSVDIVCRGYVHW